MESNHHDNVDVRVNTKINVYGNVVLVGSFSLVAVGFIFLGIWIFNFRAQAVTLAAIIVYSFVALAGLALLALVAALWIRFVIRPIIEVRGLSVQNWRVHAQDNAIVLQEADGSLKVYPLIEARAVESAALPRPSDKATVLELFKNGNTLRDIAASTGVSYYNVQKWTSEEKQKSID